ncbi:Tetratricopeptide repeat protein [Rubripirellula lacrimiformis]|uniref:Tetratricopeptide repeat protein n=1 Tax=Rubripirellula lacrimiformis TaxID=1930273 RepID=A0A517NA53_9BACT|nr:tetratricopeptide repeat protein [Rubripirellula lacrimiformis]QDT04015.1 Tetratricopeptide repeat protein [Rubripirellula lacrimiformis]
MSKRSAKGRSNGGPEDTPPDSVVFATGRSTRNLSAIWWAGIAVACVLGFGLRLWHFVEASQLPTAGQLLGDALGYVQWSQQIAAGDWYGQQTFYQAPLYPYFLAIVSVVLGASVASFQITQCLLDVASIAFIGVATRNWFGRRSGWIAAFGYAIYSPAIYYCLLIQKAGLAAFLLTLLLFLASNLQRRPRLGTSLLLGVVLGLLVLTRENSLLWIPLFPLWILFALPRSEGWLGNSDNPTDHTAADSGPPKTWPVLLSYLVGLSLVLLPVAARNASLGGEWSPTTFQSGPNFYIGNSSSANGIYVALIPGHETPEYERADAENLAEQATGHELTPRQVSRFWFAKAWADIRQSPGRWIKLMLLKTAMVINAYEVPDVESYSLHQATSAPLRVLGTFWHFGTLFPLAIFGLFTIPWRREKIGLLAMLIASMVAAVAMFFILGRYRLPLVPLMLPIAAAGLAQIRHIGTWPQPKRWTALAATAIGLVLANAPIHQKQSLDANALANMGVAAAQAGDFEISIQWLTRSIQREPDSPVPRYNLAGAYLMTNRTEQAIEQLQIAKQLDPNLVEVDRTLAELMEQRGEISLALKHYAEALRIDPSDALAAAAIRRLQAGDQP